MTIKQLQDAGTLIDTLFAIGQATAPKVKAILSMFSLTDAQLNDQLAKNVTAAQGVEAKADAQIAAAEAGQ
jgi:hypothetical protein